LYKMVILIIIIIVLIMISAILFVNNKLMGSFGSLGQVILTC
jgi:hypothetical protein